MSVQGQEHAPVARALHSCPSQQGSPVEGQAQVCLGLQPPSEGGSELRALPANTGRRRQRRAEAKVKLLV